MPTSTLIDCSIPRPGDLLAGIYRVERVIGKGSMGVVFAARHEGRGHRVAIKLLLGTDEPGAAARFLNEARAAARIQHDNIARCLDVGCLENGQPYMVLELLEGLDLEQILKQEGRLGVSTAVDHVLEALEALAQAHALGIVHRDLKPANLFLARRPDGSVTIKLLDFGVAKSTDGGMSLARTGAQALLGSPYYMSPEQFQSARTVDRRADIWSMGVILHELIAGACPFHGQEIGELFQAILAASPVPLTRLRPDCPAGLDAVVRRCLARDPARRYDGVPELADALAPFAGARGIASVWRLRTWLGTQDTMMPTPGCGVPPAEPVAALATTSLSPMSVASSPVAAQTSPSLAPSPPRSRSLSSAVAVVAVAILAGVGLGAGAFFAQGSRTVDVLLETSRPAAQPVALPTASAVVEATPVPAVTLTPEAPSAVPAPSTSASAGPLPGRLRPLPPGLRDRPSR